MAVPADPNQTHNPAEEPFDPHGQIRANDPLGKRIKTDADDPTTIPPADATGQRGSRFQMTSITRSLLEPLEPPPPPAFPPTQLPTYRGDQQWPQRRRIAFAIIGTIVISIILCLGIAIGVGLSNLRGTNGLAGNNTATLTATMPAAITATILPPTAILLTATTGLLPTSIPPLPTTAESVTPVPPTVVPPTQTPLPTTAEPATPVPPTVVPLTQTPIPPTTTLIPPTRTATTKQPTATVATTRRVFGASLGIKQPSEKSGNSGEFQSCIQGRVVDKSNRPISGAALGISNGALRYDKTTNTFGDYQFCGLGASNWQVTLFNIPPFKIAIAAQPKRTVYLNGANGQVAEVNFLEQ
jgi:hypothetical protein